MGDDAYIRRGRGGLSQPHAVGLWVRLNGLRSTAAASSRDGRAAGEVTPCKVACGENSRAEPLGESEHDVARQLRSIAAQDEVRQLEASAAESGTSARGREREENRLVAQPTADVRQVELCSLAQVACFPKTPHKFRCRVQVAEVLPTPGARATFTLPASARALGDGNSGSGDADHAESDCEGEAGLALVLRLRDKTAVELNAILCDGDAESFFKKFKIAQLAHRLRQGHTRTTKIFQRQVERLCDASAWIECCIASYQLASGQDADRANDRPPVCYRVFNTHLL